MPTPTRPILVRGSFHPLGALAAGRIGFDAADDLVIGVPNESIGNLQGAGEVNGLYSDGSGSIGANPYQMWFQTPSGNRVDGSRNLFNRWRAARNRRPSWIRYPPRKVIPAVSKLGK